MDFQKIIEHFAKEWEMIKKTPAAFAISVVLLGGIIYGALTWYYSALLTIKEEQLKSKDTQLRGKDDQLSEYREKLHILPPTQSSYARLTNAELRQKGASVVQQLRHALAQYNNEVAERIAAFPPYPPNASDEEKSRLWQQDVQRGILASYTLLFEYETRLKTDAILLRDEIQSRLGRGQGARELQFSASDFYANPTNPFGIEQVVNDLDSLVQLLPTKSGG